MLLLLKICKRLSDVPCRPFISHHGTLTKTNVDFFNNNYNLVIQSSWSYIKDSGNSNEKMKKMKN